ncbi:MAG: hypothetical protein ACRYFX_22625 [Janthinobacterium lividum]
MHWLFPLGALLLAGAAGSASRLPTCSYAQVPPAIRQLLLRFDQQLPQVLAAFPAPADSDTYDLPAVDTTQCFRELPATRAFTATFFKPDARARLLQHLRHAYHKDMGTESGLGYSYNFGVSVLEYDTPAAAAAATRTPDTLLANCAGNWQTEQCIGLDQFYVSRYGAVLVRYNQYSHDPIQRRNLRELGARLSQATGLVSDARSPRPY